MALRRKHKDIRKLFRLKKELNDTAIKAIRIFLNKKKKLQQLQICRDIKNLFEHEENYYKAVKVNSFWNNKYIEYKSNEDKNKPLSVEEYINEIRPYLKDIINYLKKSDTWKNLSSNSK